jgi:hypothetical protein
MKDFMFLQPLFLQPIFFQLVTVADFGKFHPGGKSSIIRASE